MKYGWAQIEDIQKRVGHITVAYKHLIVIWGGFVGDKIGNPFNDTFVPVEQVWFYNTLTEVWSLANCTGQIPGKSSGSSGVLCEDYLYVFGGITEESGSSKYSNNLYKLHLKTLVWTKLEPSGPKPEKCDKGVGWEYKNKLYFFGGYGKRPPTQTNFNFSFLLDLSNTNSKGWNNQFVCYDPETNSWSIPNVKGVPPNPRAAHAADISGQRVYICGGREGDVRSNDLYYIDMETLTWSSNLNSGKHPEEVPEGVSWHSFTFVSPNKAILYGGLKQYGSPSLNWWECCINEHEVYWKKQPRLVDPLVWHKAAVSKVTGELIIVGGVCDSPYEMNEEDHVDKLLVLPFQPISLFRLCLNAIVKDKALQLVADSLPRQLMDLLILRTSQTHYLVEM